MRYSRALLIAAVVVVAICVLATTPHAGTIVDSMTFTTGDQGMWGTGAADALDLDYDFAKSWHRTRDLVDNKSCDILGCVGAKITAS